MRLYRGYNEIHNDSRAMAREQPFGGLSGTAIAIAIAAFVIATNNRKNMTPAGCLKLRNERHNSTMATQSLRL